MSHCSFFAFTPESPVPLLLSPGPQLARSWLTTSPFLLVFWSLITLPSVSLNSYFLHTSHAAFLPPELHLCSLRAEAVHFLPSRPSMEHHVLRTASSGRDCRWQHPVAGDVSVLLCFFWWLYSIPTNLGIKSKPLIKWCELGFGHDAFCLSLFPPACFLLPMDCPVRMDHSLFSCWTPSPTVSYLVLWLSTLPPGSLHGFPLIIFTLLAPSRGQIYPYLNPLIIAAAAASSSASFSSYSSSSNAHGCDCSWKANVGKKILEIFLGPKCSSLAALFGDFFILHCALVGYLSTLIRFSEFWKKRMDPSLWHTSAALSISW